MRIKIMDQDELLGQQATNAVQEDSRVVNNLLVGDSPLDPFADHLIAEALTWRNTPFGKGQCVKQIGVDCGHFVDSCFRAAGVDTKGIPKRHVSGEVILDLLEQSILVNVPERSLLQPADVIAFSDENNRHPDEPVHLAFIHEITEKTTFIFEAGIHGVVRHRLNSLWWNRAHSYWTLDKQVRAEINSRLINGHI